VSITQPAAIPCVATALRSAFTARCDFIRESMEYPAILRRTLLDRAEVELALTGRVLGDVG
jgi:hypothetical protein